MQKTKTMCEFNTFLSDRIKPRVLSVTRQENTIPRSGYEPTTVTFTISRCPTTTSIIKDSYQEISPRICLCNLIYQLREPDVDRNEHIVGLAAEIDVSLNLAQYST